MERMGTISLAVRHEVVGLHDVWTLTGGSAEKALYGDHVVDIDLPRMGAMWAALST